MTSKRRLKDISWLARQMCKRAGGNEYKVEGIWTCTVLEAREEVRSRVLEKGRRRGDDERNQSLSHKKLYALKSLERNSKGT